MIAQLYGILLPAAIWCDNFNDTHYKQVQLGGLCSALMTRINSDLQRKCLNIVFLLQTLRHVQVSQAGQN